MWRSCFDVCQFFFLLAIWVKICHPSSLSCHWQVWSESFADTLAIREESQHSKCTICIKHKLIIKRLAADRAARQSQCLQYSKHLNVQYQDRCEYWASRSQSKLPMLPTGQKSITIICDGLDHQKFAYPRDLSFSAKEFSKFVRPALDCYAAILHGHGLFVSLSEPFLRKDSSFCCDVLSHVLHRVSASSDMREYEIIIQSDNTCKEIKNNTLMRWGGMMVGLHRCRRLEFRFLQSGHSHEDCDQWFAQVSNLIERNKSLQTPYDFQAVLQSWLDEGETRPDEKEFRIVSMVSACRNWTLVTIYRVNEHSLLDCFDHLSSGIQCVFSCGCYVASIPIHILACILGFFPTGLTGRTKTFVHASPNPTIF